MSAVSRLKYAYLAYMAKPKPEQRLYRQVKRRRVARIVEVGLHDARRARLLIEVAQRYAPDGKVDYTGIDLFESRPNNDRSSLSLVQAYRALAPTDAKVRLVPGEASVMLTATANSLLGTDLLILGNDVSDDDLSEAWFFIPRMLHPGSVVLRERIDAEGEIAFDHLSMQNIRTAANSNPRRQAA